MPRPSFFDDNAHRSYPFLQDRPLELVRQSDAENVELPRDAIVDFGCIVGLDAAYVDGGDVVYLSRVRRDGTGQFDFTFRSTAAGLADWVLEFSRHPITDGEYTSSESVATSTDEVAGGCGDDFLWDGFLVTGDLAALTEVLFPGDSMVAPSPAIAVEPALVQNLARGYVRAINLANAERFTTTPPEDCPSTTIDELPGVRAGDVIVNHLCMTGAIRLREGFNCDIRQLDRDSAFVISARPGAGAGEPCAEVPLYPGQAPPPGSSLLSGGPSCAEVLKSINGVSAAVLRLVAGAGVRIFAHPDRPNTLVVDVDLHGLTVQTDFDRSSQGL